MTYEPPDVSVAIRSRTVLSDPRFRNLWLSQGIAQTSQNALLFALLIIVLNITGSSIHTSLLVLCFILPSIPMGFVVGIVLDRTRKDRVLVLSNVARAGCCVLLFFFHGNEWVIYGISIGLATSGLFYNPAVVSLIPQIVPRDRLVPANSLYNFTITGSQLVGMVFVAPTLLKSAGEDGMFIAAAILFVGAAYFASRLHIEHEQREARPVQGAMFSEFRESWQVLASDRYSSLALLQLITSSTLVLLFAILIPRFMKDVIDVPADNAAFVFAPTGIGALVGLRFIPWFSRQGKNRAVVIGLLLIAACLVLLALVAPIADVWEDAPGWLNPRRWVQISVLQAVTMIIAGPMGFAYALINAPAQTILHERAPPEMRGRIFATQVVSANFVSLLPLLIIGAITDLLSVSYVLVMIAGTVLVIAWVSNAVGGRDFPPGGGEATRERRPQEAVT